MSSTCFYCDYDVNEGELHHVTFHTKNEEQEETLCRGCYSEWLQGIKG
ncbi:hypothetical protein [Litchfieldia alkalitelluris]|nr:hypothetical protein [Litchfieldia alkalitelluris]